MKSVCVFAGSSPGSGRHYQDAARALGRAIAGRGCDLVYGGGGVGLMGVLADAAVEGGAKVTGVIPGALAERELAHPGPVELRVVRSMHERKSLMSDLSDAVVALPGGLGTLEEMFEMLTWAQLGIHAKPCGLLNVSGYYDAMLAFLDHSVAEGFIDPAHRALLVVDDEPGRLLDAMAAFRLPPVKQWLDSEST